MKKHIVRMLSCTLVMGLLTVGASAAAYGPHSVSDTNGNTYSFDAAAVETRTLTFDYSMYEEDSQTEEGTVIVMQPGSSVTLSGADGGPYTASGYAYSSGDAGYIALDGALYDFGSGPAADIFGMKSGWSLPVDMVNVVLDYATGDEIYLVLGGSGSAAQPAGGTAAAPAGPGDYTVVKYDTLGQIALNNYGSYKYHTALYQANAEAFKATGGALKPGMVLNLPDTLGTAKRLGMPVAGEGETLYTVKAGDTLGGIAKAVYGDVMKYQAIFDRNSDRLTNPNTIYEGQIIVLPAK